jgi:hypothetical protein
MKKNKRLLIAGQQVPPTTAEMFKKELNALVPNSS